jgi:cyclopropane fatty-acyl-phospholipid synthase-like methyltransferase
MSEADFFNQKYKEVGHIWGDEPSEVAKAAAEKLRGRNGLKLLDAGCGYGRDAKYLTDVLDCEVTGIDTSKAGLDIGREWLGICPKIELLEKDFLDVTEQYDAAVVANVYHLLKPDQREPFVAKLWDALTDDGLFFLSAHSVNDKEEYGRGTPVLSEENSFVREVYAHFYTQDELEHDFACFKTRIFETEYVEKKVGGDHHHTAFIVIGRKR